MEISILLNLRKDPCFVVLDSVIFDCFEGILFPEPVDHLYFFCAMKKMCKLINVSSRLDLSIILTEVNHNSSTCTAL